MIYALDEPTGTMVRVLAIPAAALTAWLVVSTL